MQEKPYWRSERDDDDEPAVRGYNSFGSRGEQAPPPPPPETRPHTPPVAPLEGLISWRQAEDTLAQAKTTNPERSEKDDDDDEEDDDRPITRRAVGRAAVPVKTDHQQPEAGQPQPVNLEAADENTNEVAAVVPDPDGQFEEFLQEAHALPVETPLPHTVEINPAPTTMEAGPAAPDMSAPEDIAPPHTAQHFQQPVERPAAAPVETPYPAASAFRATGTESPMPAPLQPAEYAPVSDEYAYGYGPSTPAYSPARPEYASAAVPTSARAEQHTPADSHRHGEPLAAAVGIGLVAEHIGRKHNDNRQQGQMDTMAQETAQYRQESSAQHMRSQEQQQRFSTEQQRQAAEMQRMQQAWQEQQARQEQYNRQVAQYNLEYAPPTASAPQPRNEVAPSQHTRPIPEQRPIPQGQPEHLSPVPPAPEQQAQYAPEEQQPRQQDGHVEHSAWHSIAVDSHGHEKSGAIQYGQEFYRQREHEMLQDKTAASAGGTAAAGQGHGAGGQGALQPPYQPQQGTLPSGMVSPGLPPGPPTHVDPQHQLPSASRKQVASNLASPWFWLMLLLIIAAFFTAALI